MRTDIREAGSDLFQLLRRPFRLLLDLLLLFVELVQGRSIRTEPHPEG